MSLLPRSNADFGTKSYWNSFFKKRGDKAFEWYGEYLNLSANLGKYIKIKGICGILICHNTLNPSYHISFR